MKRVNLIKILFPLCLFLNAEAQSKVDSLLNSATLEVYENPDKAINLGNKLLKKSNPTKTQVSIYLLLSNAYSSKREYNNSLKYALLAKKESDENTSVNYSKLKVLSSVAALYHQLKVNDKALQVLDEFDTQIKKYNNRDSANILIGNNYAIRGFIYRDKLNCEIALEYFNKSLQTFGSFSENPNFQANMSVVLYNKGNCMIALNRLDSAKLNFSKSKDLAKKIQANSLLGFAQKGLAEVYTLENKNELALKTLSNAEQIASKVGDLVLNLGIYRGMAANFLAIHDLSNYKKYRTKVNEIQLKIRAEERNSISNSLSLQDLEYKDLEKNVRRKRTIFLFPLVVVNIGILFLLLRNQRVFYKKLKLLKTRLRSY